MQIYQIEAGHRINLRPAEKPVHAPECLTFDAMLVDNNRPYQRIEKRYHHAEAEIEKYYDW